jgi:hypothetical protein
MGGQQHAQESEWVSEAKRRARGPYELSLLPPTAICESRHGCGTFNGLKAELEVTGASLARGALLVG